MKLMRVASMALAAYLVNSALRTSITRVRSWLRLKGSVQLAQRRQRALAAAACRRQPSTMRSGRMKSSTAAPSFRNSGLLATENSRSGEAALGKLLADHLGHLFARCPPGRWTCRPPP
jgi:hypothetical protein